VNGERKEAQVRAPSAPDRREPDRKQETPAKRQDELDEQSLDEVLRECPL
jgi:hypothetical protein